MSEQGHGRKKIPEWVTHFSNYDDDELKSNNTRMNLRVCTKVNFKSF